MPAQLGADRAWSANSGALSGDQVLPAGAYTELVDNIYGDYPAIVGSDDLVALDAAAILELSMPDLRSGPSLAQSDYDASHDVLLIPGATTYLMEDPLVIESGVRIEAPQDALLWTDAARAPSLVSTLLVIAP